MVLSFTFLRLLKWRRLALLLLAVRALYDAHAFTMSAIKSLLALAMDHKCISEGEAAVFLESALYSLWEGEVSAELNDGIDVVGTVGAGKRVMGEYDTRIQKTCQRGRPSSVGLWRISRTKEPCPCNPNPK
jgi:hypothetical protein